MGRSSFLSMEMAPLPLQSRYLHPRCPGANRAAQRRSPTGRAQTRCYRQSRNRSRNPRTHRWAGRFSVRGERRWAFRFTPTSCSLIYAVETFFATLARLRLQRGLSLVSRTAGRNQTIARRAQPQTQAFRSDRRRQPHQFEDQLTTSSVGVRTMCVIA